MIVRRLQVAMALALVGSGATLALQVPTAPRGLARGRPRAASSVSGPRGQFFSSATRLAAELSDFERDLEAGMDARQTDDAADDGQEKLAQRIVTCGSCKAVYALDEDALGPGAGARVKCDVCGNVWFQSNARVNRLFDNFVMEPYPEARRAQFAEGGERPNGSDANNGAKREPPARGAATLFVANLPFRYRDEDLLQIFADVAPLASATVIMDEISGRSRGFGFAEVLKKEDADVAIDRLNGSEIDGRQIIVRYGHRKGQGGGGRRD